MEPIKWVSKQGNVRWQPVTWGGAGLFKFNPIEPDKSPPSLYRFKWRARLAGWLYRRQTSSQKWKKEPT